LATRSGIHYRHPSEYRRPPRVLDLLAAAQVEGEAYRRALRGVPYQGGDPFRAHKQSSVVVLELVPEPRNPWDNFAVAIDYDGQRIGYLPAADAGEFHDIVRTANRSGYALTTSAKLDVYNYEDGIDRIVPYLELPVHPGIRNVGARFGMRDEVSCLLDEFDPDTRWKIIRERSSTDGELRRRLLALRHLAPSFTWPETASGRFSDSLDQYLRDLYFEERAGQSQRQDAERRARREAKDSEREAQATAKAAAKAAETERQQMMVLELMTQGHSGAHISRELGVSETFVRTVKQAVGQAIGVEWSKGKQDERVRNCHMAADMADEGLSRRQIADELKTQVDTVRLLLRDGRFYRDPQSRPTRLQLARLAREARATAVTKSTFEKANGLSRAAAATAWRDSSVIWNSDFPNDSS